MVHTIWMNFGSIEPKEKKKYFTVPIIKEGIVSTSSLPTIVRPYVFYFNQITNNKKHLCECYGNIVEFTGQHQIKSNTGSKNSCKILPLESL